MARRRVRSALVLAAGLAGLVLSMPASPVAACSGATVTFEKVRTGAERIVLGTIMEADPAGGVAERITLRVEAVVRGVAGPVLVLEPPTFMGCEGRIMEPVGSRLLVATGPHYFSASPPQELHPYWRVLAGDVVEPAGVDDSDPAHTRLGSLIVELGGLPAAPGEPGAAVDPVAEPDQKAVLTAVIVIATMLIAAAVFVAVGMAARRRRGDR